MKAGNRLPIGVSLAFALSLAFLAGCSNSDRATSPNPPSEQQLDLNAANGGFTAADEQPAFGDAGLLASSTEEQEVSDPVAQDPAVREIANSAGVKVYAVTVLWGMLMNGDHGAIGRQDGTDHDWSGSLIVNDGATVLVSTVSFEPEDGDHMILPRPDKRTLSWNSYTGSGFDGIRLLVYQGSTDSAGQDTLFFRTPLYSGSFTFGQLESLDEVIPVDSLGNKVSVQGFLTSPASNVRGYFRGTWQRLAPGPLAGEFLGLWVGDRGTVSGFVRGEYGTNDQGKPVLFGKFVDVAGRFRGILRGTWQVSGSPSAGRAETGSFQGDWISAQGENQGQVRGHWQAPKDGSGYFEGRWCMGCVLQVIG